jgi:hypothetical protein
MKNDFFVLFDLHPTGQATGDCKRLRLLVDDSAKLLYHIIGFVRTFTHVCWRGKRMLGILFKEVTA